MTLFAEDLLPASFRGVPFAVTGSATATGRRSALHVYPGRDEPWAEDMGRAPRRFRLRGFLVTDDLTYAGGPIALQRALLTAAAEKKGSGTLIHPTLGVLSVNCPDFSISEDLDAGRYSEVEFEFVESGKKSFPSLLTSGTGLLSASALCNVALAVDGARLIAAASAGGGTRDDATLAGATWSAQISASGADATALYRLAAQLPGTYGRYAGGGNSGFAGTRTSPYSASTTVDDLVAIASVDRATIATAASTLAAAIIDADLSSDATIAAAVVALVAALADACADPADTLRLLENLVDYTPTAAFAGSAMGEAIAGMFRRAAAAALVTAVGSYQPTSADDAAAVMQQLAQLLDDLAVDAADAGDDDSYDALRDARVAIVQDLRARGASLAQVTTFTIGQSMPALILAQRLYRDPSRADQLVTIVDPIHPLFMPTTFDALAS
ncbi:DNA circularization protein [Sphingomonas abietis]|uniref:DNA circularization N-terminal domain-containing protein n=1 Tax=Sphingomonas abietis TaxID=3012344 RepID=A0ABY7NM38_9SPHN|nr:DNA circularization N-terminal domain-containing protein [Sphingomonas abietis]WBO20984.1 DNA circularization N-terminal domain-containing protein [Sphingomonas abietis]